MRHSLAVAAILALLAAPALADNTDTETVTVSGTVVASLELTTVANITMPDVVAPNDAEDATVQLSCDNVGASTVTYDGNGGNPFADGTSGNTTVQGGSANASVAGANSTGTCGELTVAGEPDFNYQVAFGTYVQDVINTNVTISAATCTSANGGSAMTGGETATLSGAGADTLYCGATVTVAAAQATAIASYSGSFQVTVTYD